MPRIWRQNRSINTTKKLSKIEFFLLQNVTNSMAECVADIDYYSETICSSIKNHALTCLQPGIDLFEECLPKESKGFVSFIVKSLLAITDYWCKADGEHILGILFFFTYF